MVRIVFCLLLFITGVFTVPGCSENEEGRISGLSEADGIEYRIINNPRIPDYDSVIMVSDENTIRSLATAVNSEFIEEQPCDPEGKFYFLKNGETFKTIYFSQGTNGCQYFAYIINGKKYFTRLSEEGRALLQKIETQNTDK